MFDNLFSVGRLPIRANAMFGGRLGIYFLLLSPFLFSCGGLSKEKATAYELQIKELKTTLSKKDTELKEIRKNLRSVKIKLTKKEEKNKKLFEENVYETVEICVTMDEPGYKEESEQTCYSVIRTKEK